ncbi:MAG: SCP2 sterol-binding domain-containing protein [Myxococcales bacterium]|nr:SCP2 sterol-binding domain-containing protein [Myxococcales bacterium]MDD9965406.1 SCP2 sterol-binding domain-containing protein [Myxococcales bacterium]
MAGHPFPSAAWAAAYKDALNNNPDYAEAGRDWTHGTVAMIVKADAALGLDQDMAVVLDVHAGECRAADFVSADTARDRANFAIEGVYERWAELIREGGDPIKALMQGRLKMTQGHLPTIIRYVESSKQLLASAQRVPAEFLVP